MIIKIDSRENANEIKEALQECRQFQIEVEQLPVGDYWVGGVVIERKTCHDLFHSLIDGRLFRQIEAVRASSSRPLLLIEGNVPQDLVRLAPNATRGLVASICVGFGVPIIWSESQEISARWIVTIAKQQVTRNKRKIRPAALKPDTIRQKQMYLLASLPGVGRARAAALLDRFGTVKGVLSAGFDDIKEVPGFGDFHAGSIVEVAESQWKKELTTAPVGEAESKGPEVL